MDYFNLRNEQRSDWSGRAKLKCTVRDFEEVKQAVDYLKAHSLNTVEDLNQAIDSLTQTAAPLRRQLKQNEKTYAGNRSDQGRRRRPCQAEAHP